MHTHALRFNVNGWFISIYVVADILVFPNNVEEMLRWFSRLCAVRGLYTVPAIFPQILQNFVSIVCLVYLW